MKAHDAIVLGAGGVGSAALLHLARRGLGARGIDRFPPGHDRGNSKSDMRISQQACFEHPDHVLILFRDYQLWADVEARSGEPLYRETGLLKVEPRRPSLATATSPPRPPAPRASPCASRAGP